MVGDDEVQALRWRTLTPLLYDWLATTNRSWPSLTCRWGPPAIAFNASAAGGTRSRQRLYWSEQTDGSAPNTLIAANVDVVLPRCASAESVVRAWGDGVSSSTFRKGKTVYHPGEVNKIREVHGVPGAELVVTHSDCPEVYLWNLATQPDRAGDARHDDSRPDCVLTGHTALAEFALATAAGSPAVASGGKDRAVCLWHLKDADGSLRLLEASVAEGGATAAQAPAGRSSLNSGGLGGLASTPPPAPKLACRARFEGHNDTVEDVAFHPNSDEQLCSVGDDSAVCFWDARAGTAPVIKIDGAHGSEDIHCCDWARHNDALVLTGSADHTVRLFDRRRAGVGSGGAAVALVHTFRGHTDAVNAVQWCPDRGGVLASASTDGLVNVWDADRVGSAAGAAGASEPAPELIFQHAGHAGSPVVDFHWSPAVPWTCVSVSDNTNGGGTIQVWRITDLLTRPEEEVLAELDKHRESLLTARSSGAPDLPAAGAEEDPMEDDGDDGGS